MKSAFSLLAASALLGIASHSQAATVALYEFPTVAGTTFPSPTTDTDLNSTASSLSVGAGTWGKGISTGSGNPVNSLFLQGLDNSSEAKAFEFNKYFQFSVAPVSGTLSFDSLSFDYRRDSAGSGGQIALYVSTTGSFTSGANIFLGTLSNVSATTFSNFSIDLSSISALQTVGTTATFRLYAWGASGGAPASQITRFDNITLTTAAIPEPSTYALFASGGLFLLALNRRRSARQSCLS